MKDKTFYANNSIGAKDLFEARKQYKQHAIPDEAITPIDFWYDKNLYGKIDRHGDAVYLLETDGVTTDFTVNGIEAVNFVVRAFNDLNEHYKEKVTKGVIDFVKGYDDIRPKKGVISTNQAYYSHLRSVKTFFVEKYLRQRSEKVTDFDSMVDCFLDFMNKHGKSFPVTKTGFVLSNRCSQNVSGLTIDFELFDPADDATKRAFLEDECHFVYFSNLCARFGFFISKNTPWKLVANLGSSKMNKYINRFRTVEVDEYESAGTVFEEYYVKTMVDDFYDLIKFLETCYAEFYENDPFFVKPIFSNGRTTQCRIDRDPLARRHPSFFFSVLLHTRIRETVMTYTVTQEEIQSVVSESLYIAGTQGVDHGLAYISDFVKNRNLNLQISTNGQIALDKISKMGNIYRYGSSENSKQEVGIVSDGYTPRKMSRVASPRDYRPNNTSY